MARRNDHTREQLVHLIIQHAGGVMQEVGLRSFSSREVAKRIGYSVGTLYHIFANQEVLILTLNSETLRQLATKLVTLNKQPINRDHWQARCHELVVCYIQFAVEHENRWRAVFEHRLVAHDAPPLAQEVQALQSYQQQLALIFDQIQQPLRFICPDKNQALQHAKRLWASVHGIILLQLSGKLPQISAQDVQRQANTGDPNNTETTQVIEQEARQLLDLYLLALSSSSENPA